MTYAEEVDPVLTTPTHTIHVTYQIFQEPAQALELRIPQGWAQKQHVSDPATQKTVWEIEGNLLTLSSAIGILSHEFAALCQARTIRQSYEIRIQQIQSTARAEEEAAAASAAATEPPSWWSWALGI